MKRNLESILQYTTPNGNCLEWTRCVNTDGYPRAAMDGSNNVKVHRVVWELTHSASAKNKVVRHSCDNPVCINPQHLLIGTPTDNMKDRDSRNRHGARKLCPESVRLIRKLYAESNTTQAKLAKMFGVHTNTVNSLLNLKHWKHV